MREFTESTQSMSGSHATNRSKGSNVARVDELEKDLIGDEVDQAVQIDSGKDGKLPGDGTPIQQKEHKKLRVFQIKQGHRRRHPGSVLSTFAGIRASSSGAQSLWEKDLNNETESFEMERDFTAKQDIGMSNQLGVSSIADKSFSKAQPKLSKMHLVGI